MGNNQTIVVITGMHRSGTSLTTSLLQSSGMFIGDRLLGNNLSNPKGHFEDLDFVEFHQSLLKSQGVYSEGWTDNALKAIPERYVDAAQNLIFQKNNHPNWGWKDPRTTLFLDFWSELIPNAKYVFVYRSPWEVVDSLFRRGDPLFQASPETAITTWLNYNQKIIDFCQKTSQPWILLRIEDVISSPQFVINSVNRKLGLNLRSPHDVYDESLFKKGTVDPYTARLVQKYFPQGFNLYSQLHSLATLPENVDVTTEYSVNTPWFWQNWLDKPIRRIKTIKYWFRLKQSVNF